MMMMLPIFSNLGADPVASLPLDFLQTPLPHGLGFSSDCSPWLDKLSIKTWDEFVSLSTTYTVLSMMSPLSVPVCHQHHKDLRQFYVFGLFTMREQADQVVAERLILLLLEKFHEGAEAF